MKTTFLVISGILIASSLFAQPARVPVVPSASQRQERVDLTKIAVVSSTQEEVRLRLTGMRATVIGQGAGARMWLNSSDYVSQRDSTSLPGFLLRVGVPYDATDFNVSIDAETADTAAPVFPLAQYAPDPSINPSATVLGSMVLRGLRTVTLSYHPMRFDGRRFVVDGAATITLRWRRSGSSGKATEDFKEVKQVEDALSTYVLNFSTARNWRRREAPQQSQLLSSESFGMGEAAVLLVASDGAYRATASELQAIGAGGVVGVPITRLRVKNRNVAVPFYVEDSNKDGVFGGEDFIEFTGHRNPSEEGLYFDDVTDSNAYILTWRDEGADTPRLTSANGSAGATTTLSAFDSTLHFEQEVVYFGGPALPLYDGGDITRLHVPERVTNERYYWGYPSNDIPMTVSFDCSPLYAPGASVIIRIRMAGTGVAGIVDPNLGVPPPIVRPIDLYLNTHISLGQVMLRDTTDTVFTFTVPAGYLINGRNTLSIRPQAMPPGSPVTLNYSAFDYIELQGKWLPTTWNDVAALKIPSSATGPQRLTVTGLTSPPQTVLTPTSRRNVDSVQRGHLFRLTSRQFPLDIVNQMRINPGFIANLPTGIAGSGDFEAGITMIEVDGSGVLKRRAYFNTYDEVETARSQQFRNGVQWLRQVEPGNFVLAGFGVGFGNARAAAVQAAADELRLEFVSLGSKEMSKRTSADMYVASWVFAIRKGSSASVQEAYGVYPNNDRGVSLNAFFPDEAGASYRAVVTVEGSSGEPVLMGTFQRPSMHYHERDVLLDARNQADLIIVTHPLFKKEAERLAEHRRSVNHLSTYVADVTTIYDEFNNGIKSPWAIRDYLQYADMSWTQPSPAYVLLFGDATTDAARHVASTKLEDFVPTAFVPVSDYILTVHKGDATLTPRQFIGRMPASNVTDAQVVVDKLIEYDLLPPAPWNRRFVFAAGGANKEQLDNFKKNHLNWAENYVMSTFFQGDTALVYRTSQDLSLPDQKDGEWMRSEVNKGAVWVNFSGHGAVGVVDLDYGLPQQFDNGNKYFVFGTFSCQTGAFAARDAQSLNELFITIPNKGAIATFGNTAWSWTEIDRTLQESMFPGMTSPQWYRTNLGAIFTLAKTYMYEIFKTSGDSPMKDSIRGRNALLTYGLLGDPSMELAIRSTVELGLPQQYAVISDTMGREPKVGDSTIVVSAQLWNFGKVILGDSVRVVASIVDPSTQTEHRDTLVLRDPVRTNQISFRLPVSGKPGQFLVRIEADPDKHFTETYLPDNVLSLDVRIRGNQPLPLEPLPFGKVSDYDNVVIRLLNPPSGPGVSIDVDTSAAFDSPVRFTNQGYGSMKYDELTTTWTFAIPAGARSADKFWWRAIATSGDTAVARLFPLIQSFTVNPQIESEYVFGGVGQMKNASLSQLVSTREGVGPGTRSASIVIEAIGQTYNYDTATGQRTSEVLYLPYLNYFLVDGKGYGRRIGMNVLVILPGETEPDIATAFTFYEGPKFENVQKFLDLIDTLKPGQHVLIATGGVTFNYLDDDVWGPKIRQALKSIGSTKADSLELEDSYALIGGRDANNNPLPPDQIVEAWKSRNALVAKREKMPYPVKVEGAINAVPKAGTMTVPSIGPAALWSNLTLDRTGAVPVQIDIRGVKRDGTQDSLMSVPDAHVVDLSGIDASVYPRLQLSMFFQSDTLERLRSVNVGFVPSPELAIVPSTFGLTRDSVMQGDSAILKATVVNLSRKYAAEHVALTLKSSDNGNPEFSDSRQFDLAPLDSSVTHFSIATDRLRSIRSIDVTANPDDIPAEPYRQNNQRNAFLRTSVDSLPPGVTIYADGARLIDGDYVAPRAEFEIRVFDNSNLKLESPKTVQVLLDNEVISDETEGARFIAATTGEQRGVFYYTPKEDLEEGEHWLQIITTDATGNIDTMPAPRSWVQFYVERDLKLLKVANWPNPFKDKTTFTFMVTGGTRPSGGEIAIFTVGGRKIKSIRLSPEQLNVGFNRVEWDGRDEDGDRLANGSYMYRVTVEDGDARQLVIETLVVMH